MIDFDSDPTATPARRQAPPMLCAVVILTLILLNSFAVFRWTRLDTRPVAWDEAVHTRNTFEYRDRLTGESSQGLFMPVYFNYPPLYNLTMIPFLGARADIADAGSAVNVLYLAGLVVAVFLIGRRLMDDWSGLAAAALIGFYPLIVMMARLTILDLALTTWVAWGFYALTRSEDFANTGWSAAFGALLGLGMLTKWTAFIYLAGPAIAALVGAARRKNGAGVLAATGAGLLVMAPWFVVNTVPMLARVTELKDHTPAGGLLLDGWAKLLWYPIGLFEQMNIVFLAMFAVGLVVSFRRPELRSVLLWFFVSILMFTLIHNKNTRYSLPALPAAALLSVAWIRSRRSGFALSMTLALAFFVVFNFTTPAPAVSDVGGVRLTYFDNNPPRREDWKHREIIEAVKGRRDRSAAFSRIVTVSNAPYFHSTSLNVTLQAAGEDVDFSFRGVSKRRWLDFGEFILLKTGNLGPDFTTGTVRDHAAWLESPPSWFPLIYKEIGRWPLPDGSEAVLFHAEPAPRPVSENEVFSLSITDITLPNLTAVGVDVNAVPIAASETARGQLARVDIRASTVTFKGLTVTNVELVLDRPHLNLPRYRDDNEVQMLSLDRLRVRGTISASTILDYARRKVRWLKDPRVAFEGDTIILGGTAGFLPMEVSVRLDMAPDALTPRLQKLKLAGVRIPTIFFRALTDRPVNLAPNRESPFRIDLGAIRGNGDTLTVGA